jgi:leucyl aminopeptidase
VAPEIAAQVLAEGVILANFEGASYQTVEQPRPWVESVEIRVAGESAALERALERGRVLGECSNIARSLSNEPGNSLTPSVFADRGATIAREAGLTVEVLDEKRIAELQMGLLLGVARGSAEPPRLLVMRHEPKKALDGVVLGLIGKGITFDTGGISIKPAENMDKMKDDMSGGAAVISAMAAIARLNAPIRVIGIVPRPRTCREARPSSRAMC